MTKGMVEIADYIVANNPQRAWTFIRGLRVHCARIAAAPFTRPVRPQPGTRIRSSPHRRYGVFFRASADQVLIVRPAWRA